MIKKDLYDLNQLKKSSMMSAYGGYSNNSRVGSNNCFSTTGENKGAFSSKHSIVEVNCQQSYKNSTDNVLKQRSSNSSIVASKQYE